MEKEEIPLKKRLFALLVAIMVMVSGLSVYAADTNSAGSIVSYKNIAIKVSNTTYNGKAQTAKVSVTATGVYANGKEAGKIKVASYSVSNNKHTAAGTYTLRVKGTGAVKFNKTVSWTISKASNPVKITTGGKYANTIIRKFSKNKARTFDLSGMVKNSKGSWTASCNSKYITNSGSNVWKIKKGTPKGTYYITITVKGDKNHKATTKRIRIVVK